MPRRFEWTPLYFKEIAVIGSNAFGVEEFEGARRHAMEIYLDLVRERRIDVTPILTHRFSSTSTATRSSPAATRGVGRREGAVHLPT